MPWRRAARPETLALQRSPTRRRKGRPVRRRRRSQAEESCRKKRPRAQETAAHAPGAALIDIPRATA